MQTTKKLFTYTLISGAALGTMAHAHLTPQPKLSSRELQQMMVEQTKQEMKKQYASFINIGLVKAGDTMAQLDI